MKKVLREKHLKELESEKERLEKEISEIGKESSELLNLRKIEQNLAKQHKYLCQNVVSWKLIWFKNR